MVPTDDPAPAPGPVPLDAPTPSKLITQMKGGTVSSLHEAHIARVRADSERRRAESDEERKAMQAPAPGQMVTRFTKDLGMPNTHMVVIFQVLSRDGTKERHAQCDLVVTTNDYGLPELVLNVPCPRCMERGVPVDQVCMKIREGHRKFYVDEKYRGQVWSDPDTGEVFTLAGKIHGDEIYRCSAAYCDYAFRINASADTGHPAVSRMQRE